MSTTINAGRVRFVSRGTYNNSTQYYLFDLVDYNGSSYIAKENTLGNLPTNTQYWQLIAEKGNTGNDGQTGPVGPTGNGISSIRKTGTDGLVDTYTITYTNGNTTTFTITNGEDGEVTETELDVLRQKVADQQKVIDQLPQVTGQGTSITLENTIEAPFTIFDVEGNSVQDGSPSPDNEVPILSAGDNGSINEKIQTSNLINMIRTLGTPSNTGYDNTNKRTFDVTTLIKFLTANNYYNAGVQIDYSLIDNGIKITTKQAGYGVGFPVILSSAKTYTISADINVIDNQMIRAIFYKEDGTYISNVTSSGTNKFLTFTTPDNTYFVVIMLTPKANVETTYSNIMLNEGNTALPYVEHKEQDYSIFVQQPFRSNKDKTIKDKFVVKSDNKKYERHYINRKIFDGTENWYQYGSNIALRNWDNGLTIRHTDQELQGYLCNIATEGRPSETLNNNVFATFNVPGTADWIVFNINTTVAEFKSYLAEKYASGNPVYVDYILAEPLDLPCTEEQIQQLENKPSTYKDFTIIQSEDETPAYLEVSGIYDLNKLINN